MLLKSIDLQGYKTFAGRTSFEFAGAITCIVGPNGSGKSNIADAIRWVLGEQSFRLLRGKKTEDMIFSGSESRSQAGMASANILFDNASGWLPVDYSEVSITRRAYRDGNNEYLLNGQRVRLRDISELLASSGLSERTYTIIGQGLVDAALALRAEERRRLFEEAAGIGLYRTRRREARRRLETTYRNIERVEDILAELKPRLRSLERQARRAGRYEQVEKDLKSLLLDYYGYHWYRVQQELNEARETARVQETMYEAVEQEQTGLDQKLTAVREEIQRTRARLGSWHRESSQIHIQRETITRDLAVLDERLRSLNIQKQRTISEYSRLEQQLVLQNVRMSETKSNTDRLREEVDEARSQLESTEQDYKKRQSEQEKAQNKVKEIGLRLTERINGENRLLARLSERRTQNDRQIIALEVALQAVIGADEDLSRAEARLEAAQISSGEISERRKKSETELGELQHELELIEQSREKVIHKSNNITTDLARLNARLDVLDQAEKALTGYGTGTQLLLNSAQKGDIRGAEGALSSQLEVPEEFETAIVAALGEYLDAVLLGDTTTQDSALEMLVHSGTKGTILPVDILIPPTPVKPLKSDDVLGVASDIVKTTPRLRPAVDLLLGQTMVVRDREAARRILKGAAITSRAVTLKGEVFYASGPISVGQSGDSSTISRLRQRRELQSQFDKLSHQSSRLDDEIQGFDDKMDKMRSKVILLDRAFEEVSRQENDSLDVLSKITLEVERLSQQSNWHRQQQDQLEIDIHRGEQEILELSRSIEKIREEITTDQELLQEQQSNLSDLTVLEFQSQLSYWNTQVAVMEQAFNNSVAQLDERSGVLVEMDKTRLELKDRQTTFDQQIAKLEIEESVLRNQEAEVIQKIEALRELIDPAETELGRLETEQDDMQKVEAKARHGLSMADRRKSQAQLTLTRKQELLDNLRERIENDLGLVSFEYDDEISGPTPLPLSEMVERLPRLKELPGGMEDEIKRLRGQLRRMGSINPEAQVEYKEVSERFEFMTSQIEDLRKAEADIRVAIAELDTIMKREFHKTFEEVAAEFREIFTRLFGGGSARLLMTDPDDLTETGIEIEARLPGRRSQGLSLLSGGERSLTATALVFALLKVSPTPFCVLDEVDAMLDEANVGRFRDLLRELAENTQFIVITHNRNTVQAADVIYGVTMGRDSASQMISLKLDEVAEVV